MSEQNGVILPIIAQFLDPSGVFKQFDAIEKRASEAVHKQIREGKKLVKAQEDELDARERNLRRFALEYKRIVNDLDQLTKLQQQAISARLENQQYSANLDRFRSKNRIELAEKQAHIREIEKYKKQVIDLTAKVKVLDVQTRAHAQGLRLQNQETDRRARLVARNNPELKKLIEANNALEHAERKAGAARKLSDRHEIEMALTRQKAVQRLEKIREQHKLLHGDLGEQIARGETANRLKQKHNTLLAQQTEENRRLAQSIEALSHARRREEAARKLEEQHLIRMDTLHQRMRHNLVESRVKGSILGSSLGQDIARSELENRLLQQRNQLLAQSSAHTRSLAEANQALVHAQNKEAASRKLRERHEIDLLTLQQRAEQQVEKARAQRKILYSETGKELAKGQAINRLKETHNRLLAEESKETRKLREAIAGLNQQRKQEDAPRKLREKHAIDMLLLNQRAEQQLEMLRAKEAQLSTETGRGLSQAQVAIKLRQQHNELLARASEETKKLEAANNALAHARRKEEAGRKLQEQHEIRMATMPQKLTLQTEQSRAKGQLLASPMAQNLAQSQEVNRLLDRRNQLLAQTTAESRRLAESNQAMEHSKRKADASRKLRESHEIDMLTLKQRAVQQNEKLRAQAEILVSAAGRESATLRVANRLRKQHNELMAQSTEEARKLREANQALQHTQRKDEAARKLRESHEIRMATFNQRKLQNLELLRQQQTWLRSENARTSAGLTAMNRLEQRNLELKELNTPAARRLAAENARLAASYRAATAEVGRFGLSLKSSNQLTASLRAGLSGLGTSFGMYTSATIVAALATYTFIRSLREALKVGADFEDRMARVASVSSRSPFGSADYRDDLSRLQDRAIDLSASTRFTALEAADALRELGLAGLDVEQAITALPSALNLAAIGALDFGTAADIATNIMLGFKLTAVDLASVVDVMSLAITRSNQNIQQLGNAMSYAAPVASSFGVELEFVTAMTMVLANAGIKASRAGTTMRRSLISLMAPAARGSAAFERLGMSVEAIAEGMEGLESLDAPVLGLFDESKVGTEVLLDRLKELAFFTNNARDNIREVNDIVGLWALPGVLQLLKSIGDNSSESLQGVYEAIKQADGAAEDMRKKLEDSLKASFDYLRGAVAAVQVAAFDQVSEDLTSFVNNLVSSVQAFADSEEAVSSLVDGLKAFSSALWSVIKVVIAFKVAMAAFSLIQSLIVPLYALGFAAVGSAAGMATFGAAVAGVKASMMGALPLILAFAGKFALVTVGLAALGALAYVVADRIFGIGDGIRRVTDAFKGVESGYTTAMEARDMRANELMNGRLAALYEEVGLIDRKITSLERTDSITNSVTRELNEQRKIRGELLEQVRQEEQFLSRLTPAYFSGRRVRAEQELIKARDTTRRLEVRPVTGVDIPMPAFLPGTQQQVAQQERQAKEQKRLASEQASVFAQWAAAKAEESRLMTEVNRLAELEASARGDGVVTTILRDSSESTKKMLSEIRVIKQRLKSELEDATSDLDQLKDQTDTDAWVRQSRVVLELADSLAQVSDEYERLNQVFDSTQVRLREQFAFQSPEWVLEQMQRRRDGFEDALRRAEMDPVESRLRQFVSLREFDVGPRQEYARLSDETDRYAMAALAIREALERVRAEGDFLSVEALEDRYQELMRRSQETATAAAKIQADTTRTAEENAKERKETLRFVSDIRAKYDELYSKKREWDSEVTNLAALLFVDEDFGIEGYRDALDGLIEQIVTFDEHTGKIDETSRRALTALLENVREAMWGIDKLITLDDTNPLFHLIHEQLAAREAALLAGFAVVDPKFKAETDDNREALERFNKTIDHYARLLELTNRSHAALAVTRARELNSASEHERSLLRVRYALEDLHAARESLIKQRDFASSLRDEMLDAEDAAERIIDRLGSGTYLDLFQASQTSSAVESLDRSLSATGDTLQGLFADLAVLAQDVSSTIARSFSELTTHMRSASAEIQSQGQVLSFSGLTPKSAGVHAGLAAAVEDLVARGRVAGHDLRITSGYRDPAHQARLYQNYLAGKGPLAAPPGRSAHERGTAMDVAGNESALKWAQKELDQYSERLKVFRDGSYKNHIHIELKKLAQDEPFTPLAQAVETVNAALEQTAPLVAGISETSDPLEKLVMIYDAWSERLSDLRNTRESLLGTVETNEDFRKLEELNTLIQQIQAETLAHGRAADLVALKSLRDGQKVVALRKLEGAEIRQLGQRYNTLSHQVEQHHSLHLDLLYAVNEGLMDQSEMADRLKASYEDILASRGPIEAYYVSLIRSAQSADAVFVDLADNLKDSLVSAFENGRFEADQFFRFVRRKFAEIAVNTIVVNLVGNLITGSAGQIQQKIGVAGQGLLGSRGASGSLVGAHRSGSFGGMGVTGWTGTSIGEGIADMASRVSFLGDRFAGASSIPNWQFGAASVGGGIAGGLVSRALYNGKGYSQAGGSLGGSIGASYALAASFGPVGIALAVLLGAAGGGFLGSLFGNKKERLPRTVLDVSGGQLRQLATQGEVGSFQSELDQVNQQLREVAEGLGTAAKMHLQNVHVMGTVNDPGQAEEWIRRTFTQIVGDMIYVTKEDLLAREGATLFANILSTAMNQAGHDPQALLASIDLARDFYQNLVDASRAVFTPANDPFVRSLEHAGELLWHLTQVAAKAGESFAQTLERVTSSLAAANDFYYLTGHDEKSVHVGQRYNVGESLAELAGGRDRLFAGTAAYYDRFFTDRQRQARQAELASGAVSPVLQELGIGMPETRAQFRALIESLNPESDAGRKAYANLMVLSEAFDVIFQYRETAYIERLTEEIEALRDLEDERLEALREQRAELERARGDWDNLAQSIADWARETRATLFGASNPVLRYQDQLTRARSGDLEAARGITNVAGQYLDFVRSRSSTQADFLRTAARTTSEVGGLSAVATQEAQRHQELLDALDSQIATAEAANESVIASLEDQIAAITDMRAVASRGTDATDRLLSQAQSDSAIAAEYYTTSVALEMQTLGAINRSTSEVTAAIGKIPGTTSTTSTTLPWLREGFSKGGIARGPKSGYPVTLHGEEAVIPLQNGSVPVSIDREAPSEVFEMLVQEVVALRQEVATLRHEQQRQHHASFAEMRETADTLRRWEMIGQPAERT